MSFYEHPYKASSPEDVPGLPPWPSRILFVGPPGSGKRSCVMDAVEHLTHWPDRIIVAHIDPEGGGSLEYSFADEFWGLDDLPSFVDLGSPGGLSEGAPPGEPLRTLIIMDEVNWGGLGKKSLEQVSALFRHGSTHTNTSIWVCAQTFTSIPVAIRQCLSGVVFCGPVADDKVLSHIGTRVGCSISEFRELQGLLRGPYDTLTALIGKGPESRYYLNMWTPVRIVEGP